MRRVDVLDVDVCQSECSQAVGTVRNSSLKQGGAELGRERDCLAVDEDGRAFLQNGFRSAFDEESARPVEFDKNRHHLAVSGELEGEETGNLTFKVIVDCVGPGGGVLLGDGGCIRGVTAANLFDQNLESSFGGLTNVGVLVLVLAGDVSH
jgi:hypothetical protein